MFSKSRITVPFFHSYCCSSGQLAVHKEFYLFYSDNLSAGENREAESDDDDLQIIDDVEVMEVDEAPSSATKRKLKDVVVPAKKRKTTTDDMTGQIGDEFHPIRV